MTTSNLQRGEKKGLLHWSMAFAVLEAHNRHISHTLQTSISRASNTGSHTLTHTTITQTIPHMTETTHMKHTCIACTSYCAFTLKYIARRNDWQLF